MGLVVFFSFGQSDSKKTIDKTYPMAAQDLLAIKNKFGNITIENSDLPSAQVHIEISMDVINDVRSFRILEGIDIIIIESEGRISFETSVSSEKDNGNFQVNYRVKLPAENSLHLENSFGDILMTDRSGATVLELSYGKLISGNFSDDLDIRLSFASAELGNISNGTARVKYSEMAFGAVSSLDLVQSFSTVSINQIENLKLESKYGKVRINQVSRIVADVAFTDFAIQHLLKSMNLEGKFISSLEIKEVSLNFESIIMENKYSPCELGIASGMNAVLEAKFRHSDLKNRVPINFDYSGKEAFKNEYRGKIGKGSIDQKILINSSYGDLILKAAN